MRKSQSAGYVCQWITCIMEFNSFKMSNIPIQEEMKKRGLLQEPMPPGQKIPASK